jgi:NADPH:quinone reductase
MSYGTTGRRVIVSEYGESPLDAVDHFLSLVEQPPPDPAELGARDVVVAVKSAAVGWVDLLMSSGQYQHLVPPPYTPGLEYAGEVVWAGRDVRAVAVGDRVVGDPFAVGPRSLGAYQKWGGFASYAVAPEQGVIPLPARLSFDEGASLLGNYETAYHCLIHRGRLQAGETALIHGASGSTGLAAVHVAKLIGATVIATGRSANKLERVKAEGADHVVLTADESGGVRRFRDEVKALTDGKGADVIYDSVGGDISLEGLRAACFGARFLIVGWAATPLVASGKGQRGAPNANVLPTNLILMKSLDVLGCPAAISVHRDPSVRRERLATILAWVESGRITPHVAEIFPLSRIQEAMHAKWKSRFVGTTVVHPGD